MVVTIPTCQVTHDQASLAEDKEHPCRRTVWEQEGALVPCYFFQVQGNGHLPDEEGSVLPSPEAARAAAATLMGELLKDADGEFWKGAEWQMQVVDEQGVTVCVLIVKGMAGDR